MDATKRLRLEVADRGTGSRTSPATLAVIRLSGTRGQGRLCQLCGAVCQEWSAKGRGHRHPTALRLSVPYMGEHLFPSDAWKADDANATVVIADVTESILDMISRPDHDWAALHLQAEVLHAVTSLMAERYGDRHG